MTSTTKHVELLLSSLGTSDAFDRQERYIDRLDALTRSGGIDSYTVTVWGEGLRTHSRSAHTTPGRFAMHRLLLLRQWCYRNGTDVRPLYDIERGEDSEQTVVFAPVICCEFTRTRLQFATPYEDDGHAISIDAHLETLGRTTHSRLPPRTDAIAIEDPLRTGQQNTPTSEERAPHKQVQPGQ